MIELSPAAEQFELLKRLQKVRDDLRKAVEQSPVGSERRQCVQAALNLTEAAFVSMRPIIDLPDFNTFPPSESLMDGPPSPGPGDIHRS
jgi:hypothetical protein